NGWTQEAAGLSSETLVSLVGNAEEGLTALGNKGSILRRSGGKWTTSSARPLTQTGATGIAACTVAKTGDVWGVGTQGVIMKRTVSDWVSETSLTAQPFTGIGCASPDDIFVVGPGGLILHKY
ncbi:MAG TPA: hypothetical protein PLY80_15415, partial [Pseudomonadota bacterium]|nr:hypothetical protein [Pseudomonadota bacterium]